MINKIIKIALLLIILLAPLKLVYAKDVNVYFFHGDGCPHCAAEEEFFKTLKNQTDLDFEIRKYEIWYNKENTELLSDLAKDQNWEITGVPFTVIGKKTFVGYLNDETTGAQLKKAIENCNINECVDPVTSLIEERSLRIKNSTKEESIASTVLQDSNIPKSELPKTINLPLFGELKTQSLSLPIITIIIGALDGFNPCAMWVLIFLISMLLGMQDRKRRWILGGAFIVTSGVVYFLFLAAWLNIILFIGLIAWVRIAIGITALATGFYSLRDYYTNPHATCKVTDSEKRKQVFEKLKTFVYEKSFWLALGGIIILAAAVNLVELICSAGLPAVFTQILALSDLPTWQYYGYMVLYIIIFM